MTARFTVLGAEVVGLDLTDPGDLGVPVVTCDLTEPDQARAAVAKAAGLLGGVDLLVNNAGRGGPAPPSRHRARRSTPSCGSTWSAPGR